MSAGLRIALAPLDPRPGDLAGNAALILAARDRAAAQGADLLLTPACSLSGAAPADAALAEAAAVELARLAAGTAAGGPAIVVGAPWAEGALLHDALFLLDSGRIAARRARHEIARGEPLDPGPSPGPVAFRGVRLGLMAGADWRSAAVAETLAETGAGLLVALDADRFRPGAAARRVDEAVARVVETGLGLLFLNLLGGEAGAVFDGAAFALNPDRGLAMQPPAFAPALHLTTWAPGGDGALACEAQELAARPRTEAEAWSALQLGLADAVAKGGFAGVLVGLDGGLTAALAADLAVAAIGRARVRALLMPAPGEPEAGMVLARSCARRLGIPCDTRPLGPALAGFVTMLGPDADRPALRARLRGAALDAGAEKVGALVLTDTAKLAGLDAGIMAMLASWRGWAGDEIDRAKEQAG